MLRMMQVKIAFCDLSEIREYYNQNPSLDLYRLFAQSARIEPLNNYCYRGIIVEADPV